MKLIETIHISFTLIEEMLEQLSSVQYIYPLPTLSGATIGQHVRHIIELFQCMNAGYENGIINYDNRIRNRELEENKLLAGQALVAIKTGLFKRNIGLLLETDLLCEDETNLQIPTNYYRELLYNLEHTIHHMALIKAGLKEFDFMQLPEEFGVAPSTINHRKTCAP